jgi:multicomponent K+:H+ antiporter subunit E
MTRWLPQPALSLGIAALWLVIASSYSINSLLVALTLGILLPYAFRGFFPDLPRIARPLAAVRLFVRVCGDIVLANWQVARQVLGPVGRLRPGFLDIPLDGRHPCVATLLGSIVSLTPGTVSIDIDTTGWVLHVHALDVDDEHVMIARIKERYERPLREIFAC